MHSSRFRVQGVGCRVQGVAFEVDYRGCREGVGCKVFGQAPYTVLPRALISKGAEDLEGVHVGSRERFVEDRLPPVRHEQRLPSRHCE